MFQAGPHDITVLVVSAGPVTAVVSTRPVNVLGARRPRTKPHGMTPREAAGVLAAVGGRRSPPVQAHVDRAPVAFAEELGCRRLELLRHDRPEVVAAADFAGICVFVLSIAVGGGESWLTGSYVGKDTASVFPASLRMLWILFLVPLPRPTGRFGLSNGPLYAMIASCPAYGMIE